RTAAQRRADALVEMAKRSAAMPADAKQGRILLTVLVDYRTFLDHVCGLGPTTDQRLARPATTPPWAPTATGPGADHRGRQPFEDRVCELSNGTVLSPAQVASILDLADVERIVFGPGSRVIDVGVRTRCFTGATRRAVEVRDRHCAFPGCREPAERCQVDHVVEYTDGGLTVQENGRLLCPVHNRQRPGRTSPPAEGP
ncbi:MAG TPA: HNH endonuclease signature motif containing protein, partial [Aquihabitans sp.]|nr:HNH endonuclease signature motif containing protein [Aquihabitans sp.]